MVARTFIAIDTDMPEAQEIKLQLSLTDIRHMLNTKVLAIPSVGDRLQLPITALTMGKASVVEHWTFRVLEVRGEQVSLQRAIT